MSGQCKCGSRAVNDDPDRLLCDNCWRDAEIERLRGEVDECRRLLREALQACGKCGGDDYVLVVGEADFEMLG